MKKDLNYYQNKLKLIDNTANAILLIVCLGMAFLIMYMIYV